jgi:hypothetical protein
MGRIGQDGKRDLPVSNLLLVGIAQVVFDITREIVPILVFYFLQELPEDELRWLFEDAVQGVESAPVRHAKLDVFHSELGGSLHQLSEAGSSRVESFNAESFEVGELRSQEVDEGLVMSESPEGGELLFLGKLSLLQGFYLLLQLAFNEVSFFLAQQMHVLEADLIAVYVPQVVFERLDGVGPIIFFWTFLS